MHTVTLFAIKVALFYGDFLGDTMTSTQTPLVVREDDMRAYERRTGFAGFGEYLEQLGEIRILRGTSCQ